MKDLGQNSGERVNGELKVSLSDIKLNLVDSKCAVQYTLASPCDSHHRSLVYIFFRSVESKKPELEIPMRCVGLRYQTIFLISKRHKN